MRLVLIVLAALLGLLVASVAALPWLVEPALRAGLRLVALNDVDFAHLRFDWDELELEGVALGQDQEIGRLGVTWRLPDLLEGRLERVEVDGLVLRTAWREGRMRLAGMDASDAGGAPEPPIPGIGQVVLRDARLEVGTRFGTLQMPFSAQVETIGEQLTFETTVDARLAGSGAIAGGGRFEGEVPLNAPLALDQARVSGSVVLMAEQATVGSVREVGGEASVGFDLADGRLQVETSIVGATWQGGGLPEARIGLVAEGSVEGAQGTIDIGLSDVAHSIASLAVDGASLAQQLRWRYAANTLLLDAGEPGALAVASLTAPDLRIGPLRARLEPAEGLLLELALGERRQPAWRLRAAAVIEDLEAHLVEPAPLELRSQAGTVTLAAEGAGQSLGHAEIGLADGHLRLPEHALALDGIATEVMLSATGLIPDQTVPIGVERVRHGGQPAWFSPIALQAELSAGAEGIAFQADLIRIGGGLALDLHGMSQLSGEGRATVELTPVAFGPDLQPQDLAPIAAGIVSDVTGEVALNGDLSWGAAGIEGTAAILVDQLALSAGPARLEQINGVVRLDRLWPPHDAARSAARGRPARSRPAADRRHRHLPAHGRTQPRGRAAAMAARRRHGAGGAVQRWFTARRS